MIHDEICSFELSKLAKEKGFNIHCVPFYALDNFTAEYVDDAGDFYEVDFEKGDLYLNYPIKGSLHKAKMLTAPTQSLLQRWMRDNGFGEVEVRHWQETNKYPHHYGWEVKDNLGVLMNYSSKMFDTYELALEDALKYALEKLV